VSECALTLYLVEKQSSGESWGDPSHTRQHGLAARLLSCWTEYCTVRGSRSKEQQKQSKESVVDIDFELCGMEFSLLRQWLKSNLSKLWVSQPRKTNDDVQGISRALGGEIVIKARISAIITVYFRDRPTHLTISGKRTIFCYVNHTII
jgi:hypothetical protein